VTLRGLVLLVIAAAALAGGCGGGGEELSRDDEAFAERVRSELGKVNLRIAAIADCVDDVACLRKAGRPLTFEAGDAATNLADDVETLDDPCLRDIGQAIVGYFDAARDLGSAAEAADIDSIALRSGRAAGLGRDVQAKIAGCVEGAADDPGLAAAIEMNRAFDAVQDPIDRLDACDDIACVLKGGAALASDARAARARLRTIDTGPLTSCQRDTLAAVQRALGLYADAGDALAAAAPEDALRVFRRAGRAEGDVARATASCVP
jgi:hypothetical protein